MNPRSAAGAADELFGQLTAEYHDLVRGLAAEIDLDAGLETALHAQEYSALVEELGNELDLDRGVQAAIDTLQPLAHARARSASELPTEADASAAAAAPAAPTRQKPVDDVGETSRSARIHVLDAVDAIRQAVTAFRPCKQVVDALDALAHGIRTRHLSRSSALRLVNSAATEWTGRVGSQVHGPADRQEVAAIFSMISELDLQVARLFETSNETADDHSRM